MTKKSSNPLAVMGCLALVGVVLFGGGVYWMSEKPIVRLKPELEKLYKARSFRCSLHAQEGTIEIEPPSSLVLDRFEKRRLGAVAYRTYLKLTKGQTKVVAMHVVAAPNEVVTRYQFDLWATAEDLTDEIKRRAGDAAGGPVTVLVAPGSEGALVIVDASCDERAARAVADAVLHVPGPSFVQVRSSGKVVWESGRDAKLYGAGAIAPIGSPR